MKRIVSVLFVVFVGVACVMGMAALFLNTAAFQHAPLQPSASKHEYPLSFKPFLTAKLDGPEWALNTSLEEFGRPSGHLSSAEPVQRVTLRLDVTNTSSEGVWSNQDVQALVTGRDSTGRTYSARSLSSDIDSSNKYVEDRVVVGSLRAHQTRSLLLHRNMPARLSRQTTRFCFRLSVSMDAGADKASWQKTNVSTACIAVARVK